MKDHKNYEGLRYCVVTLTEDSLDKLILPHHNHVNNEVAAGGEPFWKVVSKYSKWFQEGESDVCLQKLCWIKRNKIKLKKSEGFVEAKFVFVSDDRELAMPGAYKDHGGNKLYAGNFHQFVAYRLWIKENGYQPIKVYHCERI